MGAPYTKLYIQALYTEPLDIYMYIYRALYIALYIEPYIYVYIYIWPCI